MRRKCTLYVKAKGAKHGQRIETTTRIKAWRIFRGLGKNLQEGTKRVHFI